MRRFWKPHTQTQTVSGGKHKKKKTNKTNHRESGVSLGGKKKGIAAGK